MKDDDAFVFEGLDGVNLRRLKRAGPDENLRGLAGCETGISYEPPDETGGTDDEDAATFGNRKRR
ncbi:hypothetical protein C1H46_036454 [Malus baccata]|uniref:Uncharacterized protein n=1 Tax=Malus baccata TaxID=106549 RepID=A0A540KVI2_MALBA|nr:hypothetical protein C1H46_036454 [Malus baccata]